MSVELRAWTIAKEAWFEFDLDSVALKVLLDLFDEPLSPIERQTALLCVLMARTQKPVRASALSERIAQALVKAEAEAKGFELQGSGSKPAANAPSEPEPQTLNPEPAPEAPDS